MREKAIYRKIKKSVYVTADMAGKLESPSYAMMKISDHLKKIKLPPGYQLAEVSPGKTGEI